jgi:hypothetical protein
MGNNTEQGLRIWQSSMPGRVSQALAEAQPA